MQTGAQQNKSCHAECLYLYYRGVDSKLWCCSGLRCIIQYILLKLGGQNILQYQVVFVARIMHLTAYKQSVHNVFSRPVVNGFCAIRQYKSYICLQYINPELILGLRWSWQGTHGSHVSFHFSLLLCHTHVAGRWVYCWCMRAIFVSTENCRACCIHRPNTSCELWYVIPH